MFLDQRKPEKKLYNTLALPALLHSSENWTIKATDASRRTAVEMKYMKRMAGYTWTDHKTHRHCKGIKYNLSFGQNTGLQEKIDTCKLNST
jgi:hypothetical protein